VTSQVKIRQGYRPIGMSLGTDLQLLEPLDQRTTEGGASLEWLPKKTVLCLDYGLSSFTNNLDAMIVDSPYRTVDTGSNPAQGQYSLVPDNLAEHANMSLSLDQLPKTRLTANVGIGRWYQDQAFLPYTINSTSTVITAVNNLPVTTLVSNIPLPATSLNGRVDTVSQQYQITVRPVKQLNLTGRYRGYSMVNRDQSLVFVGKAPSDGNVSGGPLENEHFGYSKNAFETHVRYDLLKQVGMNGGMTSEYTDRTDREYEKSREDTLKGGMDMKPGKWGFFGVTTSQGKRKVYAFETENIVGDSISTSAATTIVLSNGTTIIAPAGTTTYSYTDMPGLRRYDGCDRFRRDLTGDVHLTLLKDFNLSYRYTRGTDDFHAEAGADLTGANLVNGNIDPRVGVTQVFPEGLQYGLLNDKHEMHSIGAEMQVTQRIGLNAIYDHQVYQALQCDDNSTSVVSGGVTTVTTGTSATEWQAFTEESYLVYGVGSDLDLGEGLSANLGWERNSSKGKIFLTDLVATTWLQETPLPDTITKKDDYTVKIVYRIDSRWRISAWYTLEQYNVTDFSTQYPGQVVANPVTGAMQAIFLGDHPSDYVASIGGVQLAAKF